MEIRNVRDALSVEDSDIADSHFSNTSLAKSRFDNVNLKHAIFTNANLADAAFTDIDFRGASISDANLAGMRINGILVEELIRAHASHSGAVLYAKNLTRIAAFYQAVAGLSVEHAKAGYVALVSPSFQLVVLKMPEHIAASVVIENPPERRTDTPIKLVFPIASIATARTIAPQHGGELFAPDREWEFQEAIVCDGVDPEGNVVQFRQLQR
jgi:predicted enzyme related to lactoylglutathione lyase